MRRLLLLAVAWALCCGFLTAAEPKLVFEDAFKGKLDKGWRWIRENPEFWRIKDDALEIRVEPGKANTVKNALVRPAPDRSQGKFAIEVSVHNTVPPTEQWEQGGITWYHEGKPVFKLVKERIDGDTWIIPGKKPVPNVKVELRLVVTAKGWTAQYRPEGKKEYLTAAEGRLPPPGKDEVSVQCYNGPPEGEHWIRFDDFRIVKLAE
jgi:hypothetical protein